MEIAALDGTWHQASQDWRLQYPGQEAAYLRLESSRVTYLAPFSTLGASSNPTAAVAQTSTSQRDSLVASSSDTSRLGVDQIHHAAESARTENDLGQFTITFGSRPPSQITRVPPATAAMAGRLDDVVSPRANGKCGAATTEHDGTREDTQPPRASTEHKDSIDLSGELEGLTLEDPVTPASQGAPESDTPVETPEQLEKALKAKEKKREYQKQKKQRARERKKTEKDEAATAKNNGKNGGPCTPEPVPVSPNPNAYPSRSLGGLCAFARVQRAHYVDDLLAHLVDMESVTYNCPDELTHNYALARTLEVIALSVIYWDAQLANYLDAHKRGTSMDDKGQILQLCLLNMRDDLEARVETLNLSYHGTPATELALAMKRGREQLYGISHFPWFDDSCGHWRMDQAMPDVSSKISQLIDTRDVWFRAARFYAAADEIKDSDPGVCYDNALERRKTLIARLGNAAEALQEKAKASKEPLKWDVLPLSTLALDIKDAVAMQILLQEPKPEADVQEAAQKAMERQDFPMVMDDIARRKDALNGLLQLSQSN